MSGTLADLLNGVERSLSDHANTERLIRSVSDLRQLEIQIDDLLATLDQLANSLTTAATHGFAPQPSQVADVSDRLTSAAREIRDDYRIPASSPTIFAAVRGVERDLVAELKDAWGSHVRARIPNAEGLDALATTLETLGAPGEAVRRLRMAADASRRLPKQMPDAHGVAELDRAASDYPEALRALMGDNDEVRRFADQLARGGAHVDALSPVVRNWMHQHGFDESFKIVAGRPAGA